MNGETKDVPLDDEEGLVEGDDEEGFFDESDDGRRRLSFVN